LQTDFHAGRFVEKTVTVYLVRIEAINGSPQGVQQLAAGCLVPWQLVFTE
jgi:hypothetical protein